ncbi:MAG: AAA family ATPase [Lachnospiraceae bacterium]|nr:AAA family ATPase [Lachnospiraceae bacterium]MBR4608307.1 AAA family ATPase [Lachnospiraceae bacterium]MBR6151282.1 AAA family ATPase [Lachnospiraceae bacterium]
MDRDLSGSAFGNVGNYTLEEIEAAQKLKKKNGGTLMENLAKVSGKGSQAPTMNFDSLTSAANTATAQMEAMLKAAQARAKNIGKANTDVTSVNDQLFKNQDTLNQELANLTKSLRDDFGIGAGVTGTSALDRLESNSAAPAQAEATREEILEKFNGLATEIEKSVFGQEEFIKKLIIAFKRPFVMPPEEPKALNCVFLSGKNDTGKHFALFETAKELSRRGVFKNSDVKVMDLGIYTDASMEKLFLQDMYSALSSSSKVLLFENFENCHPSFLTHVASLVIDGQLRLSERYVMQKGQLVNVQNSLASEVVSTFTASGKYLIFVTEKSIDKVAGIMGAPFINALGDVCVTAKLDETAIRKIAEGELAELKEKAKERFFFDIDTSEDFLDYSVTKSERQAGLKGVRDFYDGVLQALAQAKLENDYPKNAKMLLSIQDGRVMAKHEESVIDLTALLPEGYRGEIDEIRKEMDDIVGLAKVKEYVMGLEEYYKVQKRRSEEGLKVSELSKHMIFTGNPGTGKTTIARIISKYLKSIGVLTGGQLVEVSRADLVGRYVGHTAPLTNKVIASAIGGVLFIDEAYSLYRGRDDSFGLEAIDTLVKGIEDNRDNLIVILAGYSKEMEQFLTSNSGLKSRFPNVIHFPDYTGEELLLISKSIAKSKGYTIDEGADPALLAYFNAVQAVRAADAGNGRLARNKIEEAILNQSRRLVAEPDAELSVLLSQDFDLNDVMSGEK